MRFIAVIEKLALALRRDRKNLALVSGGHIEGAIRAEGEIPDVLGLGIEENRFLARAGDPIYLAIGRGGYVERAFGVKSNRLRGEIVRFKNCRGLTAVVETKNLCR